MNIDIVILLLERNEELCWSVPKCSNYPVAWLPKCIC